MNKRLHEIDSLRGLAAVSVVIFHYLSIFPLVYDAQVTNENTLINVLKFSPFHLFWAGHEAVIFFFILSGFVLSLPFYSLNSEVKYSSFLIKRICRIYLPYLFALLVSIVMYYLAYRNGIDQLSNWYNLRNNVNVDIKLITEHFIMLGSYNHDVFNPVLWSLIYELRISLIFPVLMYFIIKYDWKINIAIGVSLSGFAIVLKLLFDRFLNTQTDYPSTLHYMSLFVFGALLAKYKDNYLPYFQKLNVKFKVAMVIIGIALYTNKWTFHTLNIFKISRINEYTTSLGVVIFIIISLSSARVSKFLLNKYVHFWGKISYSLYLYHSICLLALIGIFYDKVSLLIILPTAFIASIIVSTLSYYFVEIPSINIGKYVSSRISNKKAINLKKES
jgi:peptidoglycan/LPS O-acetylase OafA/YrhL